MKKKRRSEPEINEQEYAQTAEILLLKVKLEMALAALEFYARQGSDTVAKKVLEQIRQG